MQKGARNAALSFLSASVASTGDEKAGCRLTTSVISVEQGTEIRFHGSCNSHDKTYNCLEVSVADNIIGPVHTAIWQCHLYSKWEGMANINQRVLKTKACFLASQCEAH